MKTIVWASLQSLEVLEKVDLMLPDIIDEDQIQFMPMRYKFKRGLKKVGRAYERTSTFGAGLALVTIGIMMLVPGPVDFALAVVGYTIGSAIGGPVGGAIGAAVAVALYNILAVVVIVVGVVMMISGLLGL